MFKIYFMIVMFLLPSAAFASDWKIIEGRYATVEYISGNETVADSLLEIAELSIPRNSRMIGLDVSQVESKKTRIIFTDAPDVTNGFAISNVVVIYGTSSMYVPFWTGVTNWYHQVLTHELVHHLTFRKIKRSLDILGEVSTMNVPRWFWEGTAQYYSESWNMYRGDIFMKNAILNGQFSINAFNSSDGRLLYANGHAFVRYLAATYGDSSLIKLMSHGKDEILFDFEKAFKDTYGLTVYDMFPAYNRQLILYYGDRFADYPVTANFKKQPVFGNLTDQFTQLTSDSLYLVSSQVHEIHQYRTAFLTQKKNGKFSFQKTITNNFSTKLLVSPNKRYIAYGRSFISGKDDQIGQTTRWYLYDRETEETKIIASDIRAINGTFLTDDNVILIEVKSDHSEINLYSNNGKIRNLLSTKMPIGVISSANNRLFFDAQQSNGNRDLFMLDQNLTLHRLTNDDVDDRSPVSVNDSVVIFNRYINENPAIASLNLNTNKITVLSDDQFEYFLFGYNSFSDEIQLSGWDAKRRPVISAVAASTLLGMNSLPTEMTVNPKYSAWTTKKPEFGSVFELPDTNLTNITRQNLNWPQMNMTNIFTFAFPNYDPTLGYGITFSTTWIDPLGRQAFTGIGNYFPETPSSSFLGFAHTITIADIAFLSLAYHGPSILMFRGNDYLELISDRITIAAQKSFYPDHNPRLNLTTAIGYSYFHNQLSKPDPVLEHTSMYHGVNLGSSFSYNLPTRYSSFLPKRQIGISVSYFHALTDVYNPNILDISIFGGSNIWWEKLGIKTSATFLKSSGKLPSYQLLGIDRHYEYDLPRDFMFTKTIRGLKEDIAGNQLLWSSTDLQFLLAEETGMKLFFLPLDNLTISSFFDFASIAHSVTNPLSNISLLSPTYDDKTVQSVGAELSSNTGPFRLGFGYSYVKYSNNSYDEVVYGRISINLSGM